jgi:hypothetical protein
MTVCVGCLKDLVARIRVWSSLSAAAVMAAAASSFDLVHAITVAMLSRTAYDQEQAQCK